MELSLIRDEEKEHYVYMKYFNQLMFSFSAHKTEKTFLHPPSSMLLFQIDLEKHNKDCICYITGKHRGSAPARNNCYLKLRIKPDKIKIPVIFHNLKGYDNHFIMQKLGQIIKEDDISVNVIPCNTENYMAFYIGNHLTFIDSFQFMSSSLDKLTENLLED